MKEEKNEKGKNKDWEGDSLILGVGEVWKTFLKLPAS